LIFIGLSVFLVLLYPLRSGFTDDGFIHIQYAKNLMERGEYSFNPGEVSFGTTSPLWVMVQAVLGKIFGGREVLMATSRVLSWLSGFVTLILLYLLAMKITGDELVSFLAMLAFAADAWFVRWTAMSMESSSAAMAMVLTGLVSLEAYENRRHALWLGFMLAVAALLRPEAYLFFAVYLVSLLLRRGEVDSRCFFRTILVYLLLMVPWLLFAKLHIGSFLPNTAGAKSGGLILDPVTFVKKFSPIAKIVGSTQGLWIVCALLSLVFMRKESVLLAKEVRFILLCVIALPLAYVLFDIQVLSRYLLLVTPFIPVLGLAGLEQVVGRSPRARRFALVAVSSVMIVVSVVFYFKVVVPPSRSFSHGLTHELRDLALYLNENAPRDAVVAAADIGYLAFFSERRVLDLGGLVEPATGRMRERNTYEEIVESGIYLHTPGYPHVDYFIDREKTANRFDGKVLQGHKFRSILVKEMDNLGIRKPGPYFYTLYALEKLPD
jgi:hypothetical protein